MFEVLWERVGFMLNRLGLAEEGQCNTTEKAFHFRGLQGGVHAILPIEELRVHVFKGRAETTSSGVMEMRLHCMSYISSASTEQSASN